MNKRPGFAPAIKVDKKPRKAVPLQMQKQIWDTHIGSGVKEAACPLCGERLIKAPVNRVSVEMAHIIAEAHDRGVEPSPLTMYPSCPSCNNRADDMSLFDFLYERCHHKQLVKLIISVHKVFVKLNPDQPEERLFMHNFLAYRYGYERYPHGGGIRHEIAIYNLARSIHIQQLNGRILHLNSEIQEIAHELEAVVRSVPKKRSPPVVI